LIVKAIFSISSLEVTMNTKPIRTAKDHKAALAEVSILMKTDPDIGSPKSDRLDLLVTLVQSRLLG
jgi:HTH-type transcriptional regulator / antitoxin HigA